MAETAGCNPVVERSSQEARGLRIAAHPARVLAAGLHGPDDGAPALKKGHQARRHAVHGDGGGVSGEYAAHERVDEGHQVRAARQAR